MMSWRNPVFQTLCIKTNIAAKKIRVRQSIPFIMPYLFGLNSNTGSAETNAMYVNLKSICTPRNTVEILAAARRTIKTREILERVESFLSFIGSSRWFNMFLWKWLR